MRVPPWKNLQCL